MKNSIFILISIFFIAKVNTNKRAEIQNFIEIEYTGVSESSAKWLFIATKPIDTATIEERLADLKIEVSPKMMHEYQMSLTQAKVFLWRLQFNTIITDEKTFSETVEFIDKYKKSYENHRHSDFTIVVNGTQHPIDIKRQKEFFTMLVKVLTVRKCDPEVVKSIQRFMFQNYLSEVPCCP